MGRGCGGVGPRGMPSGVLESIATDKQGNTMSMRVCVCVCERVCTCVRYDTDTFDAHCVAE